MVKFSAPVVALAQINGPIREAWIEPLGNAA